MSSNEKSFLQTTQQLAGVEAINTTRLLMLKSWQADLSRSPVDKTWVLEKINKRSYLQSRISIQSLRMWHCFKSIPQTVTLNLNTGQSIEVFAGNWTEDTLANFLTTKLQAALGNTTQKVTYDPYQFRFLICPPINIDASSTINKYLGFPSGEIQNANVSAFPPIALRGPQCINVWTNFTMNSIPISHFMGCIPVNTTYGNHIHFTNYDVSEAALVLDPHIDNVSISLQDEFGNPLEYYDELPWEVILSVQSTVPEGFAPLEL